MTQQSSTSKETKQKDRTKNGIVPILPLPIRKSLMIETGIFVNESFFDCLTTWYYYNKRYNFESVPLSF